MTIDALRDTLSARAIPAPDNASAHYWQSAAEGKLVLQRCVPCGDYQFYPRALCASCAGETEWVDASGRGTLYTFTIIRQNRSTAFKDLSPYAVGIIELEEGVRMMSNIVDCDVDRLEVGMALEVLLLKAADDVGLPVLAPGRELRRIQLGGVGVGRIWLGSAGSGWDCGVERDVLVWRKRRMARPRSRFCYSVKIPSESQ